MLEGHPAQAPGQIRCGQRQQIIDNLIAPKGGVSRVHLEESCELMKYRSRQAFRKGKNKHLVLHPAVGEGCDIFCINCRIGISSNKLFKEGRFAFLCLWNVHNMFPHFKGNK